MDSANPRLKIFKKTNCAYTEHVQTLFFLVIIL
jgi:hypothetical protein